MSELSPNLLALPLVKELINKSNLYRINPYVLNKVTIIDCGVKVAGGWEAGILYASICLGGLARVDLRWHNFEDLPWRAVEVITDHPIQACLASQYAGWPIKEEGYIAIGSGPGRAIIGKGSIYKNLGLNDNSSTVIICLESEELPSEEVVNYILAECKCDPNNLYILVAPTTSLVGSVQIAARVIETGLSKLMILEYDLEKVDSAWGICPIAPIGHDSKSALGRTNDAIFYGSTVLLNLHDSDETLSELVKQMPSSANRAYGQSFLEIFKSTNSFYDIDPILFSPAKVLLSNLNSGRTFQAGRIRSDILRSSFGLGQI